MLEIYRRNASEFLQPPQQLEHNIHSGIKISVQPAPQGMRIRWFHDVEHRRVFFHRLIVRRSHG